MTLYQSHRSKNITHELSINNSFIHQQQINQLIILLSVSIERFQFGFSLQIQSKLVNIYIKDISDFIESKAGHVYREIRGKPDSEKL